MQKIIFTFISFCIFITACSQIKTINKVETVDDKRVIKISLEYVEKPTNSQREKFNRAAQLINNYLNSKVFKTMVLNGPNKLNYIKPNEAETKSCNQQSRATYTYNTVKGSCFNNQELYKVVKSAEWNLKVKVKPSWGIFSCKKIINNAIGALEGDVIVTAECHFDTMSDALLAGFLMHEYMHVIGFRHPYESSLNRKNTIPYFIGDNAIRTFAQKLR